MLSQKQYDKISHIKEQDFITIITAIEGGVDWEYFIMLYASNEYSEAVRLLRGGWLDGAEDHEEKAEKALNFLNIFRKLNTEVTDEQKQEIKDNFLH